MIIRDAVTTDLDIVHELSATWEAEGITHGLVTTPIEHYHALLGPYFLVVEEDGIVVGFITGVVQTSEGMAVIPAGVPFLEIDELYVAPAYRSQSVGRQLVETLLARAEAAGISHHLVYSATKDVHRILRFYEQCGFQSWCVQLFRQTGDITSS